MSIILNQFSAVRAADVKELLEDETAKAILVRALDQTQVQRREAAADFERLAPGRGNANLARLALMLDNLSAQDVADIKQQLAAQEAAAEKAE